MLGQPTVSPLAVAPDAPGSPVPLLTPSRAHVDAYQYCLYCCLQRQRPSGCSVCGPEALGRDVPRHTRDLAPGTLLAERYLVGRVLGASNFGITYLGVDVEQGARVAVKEFFPRELAMRASDGMSVLAYSEGEQTFRYGLRRTLEEASVLAQLADHPNLVTVLDSFEACGTGYVVTRHVEGRNLDDFRADHGGRLPESYAVPIIKAVLNALRALHGAEVLHRDVTPRSIYLTEEQGVFLDLGTARFAAGLHGDSLSQSWTRGFVPVEQIRGGAEGTWTDVYAAGAVLYTLLTGTGPPDAEERAQATATLKDPSTLTGGRVSDGVSRVVMKALAIRGDERIQTPRNLVRALDNPNVIQTQTQMSAAQALPERSQVAPTPPSGADYASQPRSPVEARRGGRGRGRAGGGGGGGGGALIIGGVVALLLTIGAVVFFLSRGGGGEPPGGDAVTEPIAGTQEDVVPASGSDAQAFAGAADVGPKEPPRPKLPGDSPIDYRGRIRALEQAAEANPGDAKLRSAFAVALLDLQDRYPMSWSADPELDKTLKIQLASPSVGADPAVQARRHILDGKPELALSLIAEGTDSDQRYVTARALYRGGKLDEALARYAALLADEPDLEKALYDTGRILLAKRQLDKAIPPLERVLQLNDKHVPAALALGEIALLQARFKEADTYVGKGLGIAKTARDRVLGFQAYHLEASLHEKLNDRETRIRALENAQRERARDEATAITLAELVVADSPKRAQRYLQTAREAGGDSPALMLQLIKANFRLGLRSNAKALLTEAQAKHPKDTSLLMLAAELDVEAKQVENAKGKYAAITLSDPTFGPSYLALAKLQWEGGQQDAAIEVLESGRKNVPKPLQILELLATYQMATGKTLDAKATMKSILERDPNQNETKLRFAVLLKGLNYPDESLAYFRDLEAAGALDGKALVDFADVLFKKGVHEEALEKIEAAKRARYESLELYLVQGAILVQLKRSDEADEVLQTALKLDEESAEAYHYLGVNELLQRNIVKASTYLGKAVELAPRALAIRFTFARTLASLGGTDNLSRAMAEYTFIIRSYSHFKTAIERKEINAEVYLDRGELYYRQGKYQAALADFKVALTLDKASDDILVAYSRALRKTGQEDAAEEYLYHVLDSDPENAAAAYYLGLIHMRAKRSAKAIEHFSAAVVKQGHRYPDAFRHLGYLYMEKGMGPQGCQAFKDFLRVAADRPDAGDVRQMISRRCR